MPDSPESHQQHDQNTDYANIPPPIPSPGSPSYTYYIEAMRSSTELMRPIDIESEALSNTCGTVTGSQRRGSTVIRRNKRSTTSLNSNVSVSMHSINSVESNASGNSNLTLNINNKKKDATGTDADDSNALLGLNALKLMAFNVLDPKQHLILGICREIPYWTCLYYMTTYFYKAYEIQVSDSQKSVSGDSSQILQNLYNAKSSEYLIAGIWCLVSAFMVYSILDGLLVRWIMVYSITAAIVRMVSMTVLLLTIVRIAILISGPNDSYLMYTWILISCIMTGAYIIQNFFVNDLDDKFINNYTQTNDFEYEASTNSNDESEDSSNAGTESEVEQSKSFLKNIVNGRLRFKSKKLSRYFNYYNIVIYAVMPVGVASFFTMIILLRNMLILKLDIESLFNKILIEANNASQD